MNVDVLEVEGEQKQKYVQYCKDRLDLVVRASNIANPDNYTPILWALHGKEKYMENKKRNLESSKENNKRGACIEASNTLPPNPLLPQQSNPLLSASNPVLAQLSNPLLAQQSNPLLEQQSNPLLPQQSNPLLSASNPLLPNPLLAQQSNPLLAQQSNPLLAQQSNPLLPQQSNPLLAQQSNPLIDSKMSSDKSSQNYPDVLSATKIKKERGMNSATERRDNLNYIKDCKFSNVCPTVWCTTENCRFRHRALIGDDLIKNKIVKLSTSDYKSIDGECTNIQVDLDKHPNQKLLTIEKIDTKRVDFEIDYCTRSDCFFGCNCIIASEPHSNSDAAKSVDQHYGMVQNLIKGTEKGSRKLNSLLSPELTQKIKEIKLGQPFYKHNREDKKKKAAELFNTGKLFLAPLTTVGNLPFRRIVTKWGCDVTLSEMAVGQSLARGMNSELQLVKRHEDEKNFGIQIAGGNPKEMIAAVDFLNQNNCTYDFIDINMGCPLEQLHKRFGGGSVLMAKQRNAEEIIKGISSIIAAPLSCKIRSAHHDKQGRDAHKLAPKLVEWGADAIIHHGRTAKSRYTGNADWKYIQEVAAAVPDTPFMGNGDVFSPYDMFQVVNADEHLSRSVMIGRGALIKPWIFKEIKDNKLFDISASARLDLLRDFCNFGLEHWGSDKFGVETTRKYLLEQLSFLCRYVPVGLLERVPQNICSRPPNLIGRSELETIMASTKAEDMIKISEMFLGRRPNDFTFIPKHKSNSY